MRRCHKISLIRRRHKGSSPFSDITRSPSFFLPASGDFRRYFGISQSHWRIFGDDSSRYFRLNAPVFELDVIWNHGVRRPGELTDNNVPRLFFCWRKRKTTVKPFVELRTRLKRVEFGNGTFPYGKRNL